MLDLSRYVVKENGEILDKENGCKRIRYFKSNKYYQCCIHQKDGSKKTVGVHTVIAMVHCPDWFDGCVVHHKDENTHNNNAENLVCYSREEHSEIHANRKYFDTIAECANCGKQMVWTAKKKMKHFTNKAKCGPFCSKKCIGQYYGNRR